MNYEKAADILKAMGERIKARREALGLSQDYLAEEVGYFSHASIAKVELGLVDLPQSKIMKIAKALKTTPNYILGAETSSITIPRELNGAQIAFYEGTKDLTEKLIENNKQKERLEGQLKTLKSKLKPREPVSYKEAKDLVSSLEAANYAEKRLILKSLINKITFYYSKDIKIEFNF